MRTTEMTARTSKLSEAFVRLSNRKKNPVIQLVSTSALGVLLLLVFFGVETFASRDASGLIADIRPALLCVSLLGFSIVSYIVWPSRWNVPAHTQLAFGIVAYVIPLLLLGGGRKVPDWVLTEYTGIMLVGVVTATLGTIYGGWIATRRWNSRVVERARIDIGRVATAIPFRIQSVSWLAIAGVLVAFAVMGFVPALAADPFAAKFFRGVYAESYAPVAPLYRAATSALTVLLPMLTMYAVWRRKASWIAVFLGGLSILLLTLQREPAASGILLFVGVLIALHRRGMFLYFIGIVAVYFAGSASYFVLAALGIGSFASGVHISPIGLLENVAAGAPDVSDQFVFLQAWLANPIYANGMTFFGGLIPGNFEWNPAVWSLSVTYPGADITQLNTGGFRLPGPLWGYVNFGWVGAAIVGALYGTIVGYLTRTFSAMISRQNRRIKLDGPLAREAVVLTFVVYVAVLDCAGQFFALSYVTVVQTALVLAIIYVGFRRMRKSAVDGLR